MYTYFLNVYSFLGSRRIEPQKEYTVVLKVYPFALKAYSFRAIRRYKNVYPFLATSSLQLTFELRPALVCS